MAACFKQSFMDKLKTSFVLEYFLVLLLLVMAGCAGKKHEEKKAIQPVSAKTVQKEPMAAATPVVKPARNIKVIFIELGSVGCTPCVMMAKIMDEIEKEYNGQVLVRFYDVNSLLGGPYAQKYGIRIIPTQVFLDKERNEYYRHEGFFPKEDLVKVLQMKGVK